MNRIKKAIKRISINDIVAPILFLMLLVPSFLFRLMNIIKKRKLWLVAEEGQARDNGYYFYKYVREKHPNDYCFYAIKKDSAGLSKVNKLGNIIKWGSISHWLFYMSANLNISSQKNGNPCPSFWYLIHVVFGLYRNRAFLQHGITKDDSKWLYYKNTKFKYFVCGAQREYDYVLEKFGYKKENLILAGFPRWDNLKNVKVEKKSILIMPTWRSWLKTDMKTNNDCEAFKRTDYYKNWNSLLNDKQFVDYIEKNDINVYFYPHINMISFLDCFRATSDKIKLVSIKDDIQEYFNKCDLMITDYSSVAFDFAYLKKPVIYFQFDYARYRKEQLQEGYYNYRKDGFGPVVDDVGGVCDSINRVLRNGGDKMSSTFFTSSDQCNSDRLYSQLSNRRKNILHVIYTLNNGGTQKYLVNLLKETQGKYCNTVVYYHGENAWEKELNSFGVKTIKINGNNKKRFKELRKIMTSERIGVVYSYSFYNSIIVLLSAKIAGVKKRIVHSHRTAASTKVATIESFVARLIISALATDRLACSDNAGKALFIGRKYKVISNGIELNDYAFDILKRLKMRKELKVNDNEILLGTIGRLDDNKNQIFMLDILDELKRYGGRYKLAIIGDGENREKLEKEVKARSLDRIVVLLGERKNACDYYNAFDVFLLTSYKEGLPFVLIEAQANGLPIFASSSISDESKINNNMKFVDLSSGPKEWAKDIAEEKKQRITPSRIIGSRYSISATISQIEEIYEN